MASNGSTWFPAQSGFNYQGQYKDSLGTPAWTPLADMRGDNAIKSDNDPAAGSARFHRVPVH